MLIIDDIVYELCGNDYLEPYLRREMGLNDNPDDDPEPTGASALRAAVKIFTDDDAEQGYGSTTPDFDRYCRELSLPIAVLHCQNIVGTGMHGLPRRIAAGIHRGTFVHIADNEARISVVHAVDVARAAVIVAGAQGTYTLTDNTDPTIHDLAEALAFRLGNKRILTIKPRWARLWYGRDYYRMLTTDHVSLPPGQCSFCRVFPDMQPVEVIDYLRTHVYDEKSL